MDWRRSFLGDTSTRTSLAALGLLAACSSGGSGTSDPTGGAPEVSFSFEQGAVTLAESAGPTGIRIVLHATPPVLETEVSVEVVDAGTGTATPASDYAAFAPQTITFPAGARKGDSREVKLHPLDDSLVDGASETVNLRLQNPSAGELASPAEFRATVTDVHAAVIAFATPGSATPDESNRTQAVALELDCGPGVTLGVAASVTISDLRTGSADPTDDYSSFAPRTVTFPAGRADGAIKTVNVQVVDDGAIEGDETIELGLSAPSSTCALGAISAHVLTIRDDDLAASATFLASEGPTGMENALAHDELVPLGTQTVGAGPNTGTLVRVANGGGTPMGLAVPRLGGSHPNDFAVEVDRASAPALPWTPGSSGGRGAATGWSPLPAERAPVLALAGDTGPGLALRLDAPAIARLAALERVELQDFPLPELGPVTLALERRPLPLGASAKLVVDDQEIEGGVGALVGDLQIWAGNVAGMPGSRVFLALSASAARGFLELPFAPDRLVHVTTDGPGTMRLTGEMELAARGLQPRRDFCSGERLVTEQAPLQLGDPDGSSSALTVADCKLALETDHQLFQKFGSSAGLASYVTALIAAVSEQYFTDVQTTLSIAYLGIHTTADDGWTTQETPGGDDGDLLDEFQAAWGSSWPAQADLAHFLSGAPLGGGIAFGGVLCHTPVAFAVSANLTGAIDWSAWTGQPASFTWDFVVVAHELGHNFGSRHTHDYCPPLDRCWANCTGTNVCSRGTLLSYCNLLCGGLANIDLRFHPVTAEIMRQRINASCLDRADLSPGDFVQYRVRFNPLSSTGSRSATLELGHDAANVPQPFRVQLSGTAR